MKQRLKTLAVTALFLLVLLLPALPVAADEVEPEPEPPALPAVIITEVQTGNATRDDEFIELHNTTSEPLDLTGWRLHYITASATSTKNVESPSDFIDLTPPIVDGQTVLVPAGGYYLLYAGAITLPDGAIGQQYQALLPATGGSLVLVSPDDQTCELVVEDALAWGSTTHLFGEGEALTPGPASANDRLFGRYIDAEGNYVDTGANAVDFLSTAASSGTASRALANTILLPEEPLPGSGAVSQLFEVRFANQDCVLPPDDEPPDDSPPSVQIPPNDDPPGDEQEDPLPTIPAGNVGLKSPQISELLPNPASPQSDANDEFIELYNPNEAPFILSGYVLEVGLATKHRYAFPEGTTVQPKSFLAFFSADTKLTLSNSGGQAVLFDPLGARLVASDPYGPAKDGQAWLLAEGSWQWTTQPTPNAINAVSSPVVKAASTSKSASKSAKKATTAKKATSKDANPGQDVQDAVSLAATASTPLHPGVLAVIAASAILYGAYEYRRDMANKLYQLRTNRAARRALRQSVKGR